MVDPLSRLVSEIAVSSFCSDTEHALGKYHNQTGNILAIQISMFKCFKTKSCKKVESIR